MAANPMLNIMLHCSGIAIIDAFERIVQSFLPNNRLIGPRNYYLKDTKERVDRETSGSLRTKQIEEYIASSIMIHCADGWGYLSRSVESLLNGDIPNSIHFAYYAELRSAMSIMAHEGIGIFNRQHIWFDDTKVPTLFKGYTTHGAVDQGMNEWSNLSSKKDSIFGSFKVNNHSFSDWIRETGSSTKSKYTTSVINKWLKKWSIDLHFKGDQDLRNELSYRPHFNSSSVNIEDVLTKLSQIWQLLEPTHSNSFHLLDQHFLRIVLEEIYSKSTGKDPKDSDYKSWLGNTFTRLGENDQQELFRFLLRLSNPNNPVLLEEAKKDNSDIGINKNDPFPIICRAILLLRLATGVTHRLIQNSSATVDSLKFWWEDVALKHGFTNSIPSGIDPIDLFTDIRDSINEFDGRVPGSIQHVKDAFNTLGGPLFYLKQFERPGIWGMGL